MRALRTSPAGFPMAPSAEEWEALSPTDRAAVVAELPGEVTDAEMSPPEGDLHFRAKVSALDALRGHFARQRRQIYLAAELPIYYPAEPRFAPDLIASSERPAITAITSSCAVSRSTAARCMGDIMRSRDHDP